jgi:FKBP-type peptidyl-prolyl cis-trans isomerase
MYRLKLFFTLVVGSMMMACSEKNASSEKGLSFNNEKEKLSYVLGAMNAQTISRSKETSFMNLDKEEMIKGFNTHLNEQPTDGCMDVLKQLFGPTYQDFNEKYLKEGSLCMGKMTGHAFYSDIKKIGGIEMVDLNFVKKGYADGLYRKDTLMSETEMRNIMSEFMTGLNVKNGQKMMEQAKMEKGAQVFENGIIMRTIKDGKGGMPTNQSDVKVHYVLMSALGDTIQDSKKMKNQQGISEPIGLKLNGGVIPGWSFAIPKMKKGGLYRIYIPWDLAYGVEAGKESLCFDVELIDFGPEGTFVK